MLLCMPSHARQQKHVHVFMHETRCASRAVAVDWQLAAQVTRQHLFDMQHTKYDKAKPQYHINAATNGTLSLFDVFVYLLTFTNTAGTFQQHMCAARTTQDRA